MLQRLAPDVTAELLTMRIGYAAQTFHDMIIDRDQNLRDGMAVMSEGAFRDEAIGMLVAHCFRAPATWADGPHGRRCPHQRADSVGAPADRAAFLC
jgi:hypothetical protein